MIKLRWILTLLIVNITISNVFACDQCGCSIAGSYNNVTAYAHNNYMMLKGSYYQFNNNEASSVSKSTMLGVDFIVGYNITPNLHLLGYLPYKSNNFTGNDTHYATQGLGDGGLLANYTLFTNRDNKLAKYSYALSLKGGVELPTGKFISDYRALGVPANISLGSASIDALTGLRYIYKKKNTTLIADYSYKFNTENNASYKFGQQQAATILAARRFMHAKSVFTPYAGVALELDGTDYYHSLDQHGTDGQMLMLNTGLEFGFNSYIVGVTADIPVYTNFDDEATSSPRLALRLAYMFVKQ
jgi:hypothetical protein